MLEGGGAVEVGTAVTVAVMVRLIIWLRRRAGAGELVGVHVWVGLRVGARLLVTVAVGLCVGIDVIVGVSVGVDVGGGT